MLIGNLMINHILYSDMRLSTVLFAYDFHDTEILLFSMYYYILLDRFTNDYNCAWLNIDCYLDIDPLETE